MKRKYLIFLIIAVMSCGNKSADKEINILDDQLTDSIALSGYTVRIPKHWESVKISETGFVSGVEIKMLWSFTNRETVIRASILEIKEDTGLEGLDGYFYAVSQAFSESEAHLSQIQINDILVKSIRITDKDIVILKSVFYEESRGFFQLDFIIPIEFFDKYSQIVSDIVNTIK